MKVLIATPLYPPDVAEQAVYVKGLAHRLSPLYAVTVLTYGSHPEPVPGVRICAVSKHLPLPLRLGAYFLSLVWLSLGADVLYVQNGPSTELPAGIAVRFTRKRMIFGLSDCQACNRAKEIPRLAKIERFVRKASSAVVDEFPIPRPEILPFSDRPDFSAYEESWAAHLEHLQATFHI